MTLTKVTRPWSRHFEPVVFHKNTKAGNIILQNPQFGRINIDGYGSLTSTFNFIWNSLLEDLTLIKYNFQIIYTTCHFYNFQNSLYNASPYFFSFKNTDKFLRYIILAFPTTNLLSITGR